MREGIECEAIHSYGYRSRENQSFIKGHPVGVVVTRHGKLWKPIPT
jgi:hypothetical protein